MKLKDLHLHWRQCKYKGKVHRSYSLFALSHLINRILSFRIDEEETKTKGVVSHEK